MDSKAPIPRAILAGIQTPQANGFAHEASLDERAGLVKTPGHEVVGRPSQRRDGTGVVASMAPPPKSKARERFESTAAAVAAPDAPRRREYVIVDHEPSPGQIRDLEHATGVEVLVQDRLFATLDTTMRVPRPQTRPRVPVSDTVGFIGQLPCSVLPGHGIALPGL